MLNLAAGLSMYRVLIDDTTLFACQAINMQRTCNPLRDLSTEQREGHELDL